MASQLGVVGIQPQSELRDGLIQRTLQRRVGARVKLCLDRAQDQPHRGEPLLGPIVQIALEPAAFRVTGRDDALA